MIARRLIAVGVVVTLAAAAACSDDDEAAPTTTRRARTTTSTTTTETTTTTVDITGIEGPPKWVPVVVELYQRMHELRANPDVTRVTAVFSENCPCFAEERETVQFLVDEGLHFEGHLPRILKVQVGDERPGRVRLTVTIESRGGRLVDANGDTYQEFDPPVSPGRASILLVPDVESGIYRVFDFRDLDS